MVLPEVEEQWKQCIATQGNYFGICKNDIKLLKDFGNYLNKLSM
jgi:hypothetical protein